MQDNKPYVFHEVVENTYVLFGQDADGCGIEGVNVPLAIAVEVLDMREIDEGYDECRKPLALSFSMMPRPKTWCAGTWQALEKQAGGDPVRGNWEWSIWEYLSYYGGVPIVWTSVQGGDGVIDVLCDGMRGCEGCVQCNGILRFEDIDTIEQYLAATASRSHTFFGMSGFYLDNPINRMGWVGWDVIRQAVFGRDMPTPAECLARWREQRDRQTEGP